MKIKIVSDGTGPGTQIVNAETGEPIERVMNVTWSVPDPGALAVVTMTVHAVEAEIEGETDA